jgi:hypothetical protein
MHIHPSKCLQGPVSANRPWWRPQGAPAQAANPDNSTEPLLNDDDPTFRADLVARIRRQIAEGTYGTQEQLEKALDRLLDQLEHKEE